MNNDDATSPKIDLVVKGIARGTGETLDVYAMGDWDDDKQRLLDIAAGVPWEEATGEPVDLLCAICGRVITQAPLGTYPPEALHLCHRHTSGQKREFMRMVYARDQRDR